jgi:hypothetical protein
MSPPINLPDGTEVSEVILPDGSTASEVVAPDGTQVFGSGIPDSGLLHYYRADSYDLADGQTISTNLTDLAAADALPVVGDPTFAEGAVNGNDAIRYDGSDDRHEGDFSSPISEPFERFLVGALKSSGTANETMLDGGSSDNHWLYYRNGSGDWRMFQGSVLDGPDSVSETTPHLFAERWDNGSSQLRVDQSDYMSGNTGSQVDLSGLTIGDNTGSSNPANFDFVACAIYDPSASGYSRSDVEQFFVDEFGPF